MRVVDNFDAAVAMGWSTTNTGSVKTLKSKIVLKPYNSKKVLKKEILTKSSILMPMCDSEEKSDFKPNSS